MMRTPTFALILLLFVGLFSGCSALGSANSDQETLDTLRQAGSDLSKPHPFNFYLYHPDQAGAQQLCNSLSADGFQVTVQEAASDDAWLCLASLTMLPTIENLAELQEKFELLIATYRGEYDGWETRVTP